MDRWQRLREIVDIYLKDTGQGEDLLAPLAAEQVSNVDKDLPLKTGCSLVPMYNRDIELVNTVRHPQYVVCKLKELYRFIDGLSVGEREKILLFWWYSAYVYHDATPMSTPGWNEILHHTILDVIDTLGAFHLSDGDDMGLLLFSFSPVQPFIEGAKKLKDLWGGSYLLSLFTLSAIKQVFESKGVTPYNIILPSIRHNHMVYTWMKKKYGKYMERIESLSYVMSKPLDMPDFPHEYMRVAGLPNRILLLVSEREKDHIVGAMDRAIRETWNKVVEVAVGELRNVDGWEEMWHWQELVKEEKKTFPQTYHAFIPLTSDIEDIKRFLTEKGIDREWNYVKEWFNRQTREAKKLHPATYVLWHVDAVNAKHGGVKAFTPFYPYEMKVECPPLLMDDLSGKVPAAFVLEDDDSRIHRFGVASLVKRYMEQMALSVIEDEEKPKSLPTTKYMGFDTGSTFPSVSWVAGYKFVKWAKENGICEDAVKDLIGEEKLWGDLGAERKREIEMDRGESGAIAEYIAEVCKKEIFPDESKILLPSGYYSVLMLDGDKMGAWFSATHEVIDKHVEMVDKDWMFERFYKLISESEAKRSIYRGIVLGPAYLRNLSTAIGTFAYLVPAIVMHHGGFMVYVGGDDVLAILPPETVFDAIEDIKMLFAGGGEEGIDVLGYRVKKGIIYKNGKPLAMLTGTAHTMSGGVAIYWLKDPLVLAVRDAREGEGKAKGAGRNAVNFIMRERSGRPIEGVLKWEDDMKLWKKGRLKEMNRILEDVWDSNKLSPSFLYEMYNARHELEAMATSPHDTGDYDLMRQYFAYFLDRHGLKETNLRERLANYLAHEWWQDALAYMKVWLRIWRRGR